MPFQFMALVVLIGVSECGSFDGFGYGTGAGAGCVNLQSSGTPSPLTSAGMGCGVQNIPGGVTVRGYLGGIKSDSCGANNVTSTGCEDICVWSTAGSKGTSRKMVSRNLQEGNGASECNQISEPKSSEDAKRNPVTVNSHQHKRRPHANHKSSQSDKSCHKWKCPMRTQVVCDIPATERDMDSAKRSEECMDIQIPSGGAFFVSHADDPNVAQPEAPPNCFQCSTDEDKLCANLSRGDRDSPYYQPCDKGTCLLITTVDTDKRKVIQRGCVWSLLTGCTSTDDEYNKFKIPFPKWGKGRGCLCRTDGCNGGDYVKQLKVSGGAKSGGCHREHDAYTVVIFGLFLYWGRRGDWFVYFG